MVEREEENHSPSFPEQFYLPALLRIQNPDGGWGYHSQSNSSAEPTAWALLALRQEAGKHAQSIERATKWLRQAQQVEGAWPTPAGEPGCWVTALACLALLDGSQNPGDEVLKGLQWLLDTWPAEGNLWWRLRQRWHKKPEDVVRQDHALQGWGWTPGTASWVEPTAYILILLRNIPARFRPAGMAKRRQLAERMLCDRACPGGGWNAGNPMVYGVPGEPRIGPTAWALLALRDSGNRPEFSAGLDWLERNYENVSGPGSLAVARLCLAAYGRRAPGGDTKLRNLYEANHFLNNVVVLAWAGLASSTVPAWLATASRTATER